MPNFRALKFPSLAYAIKTAAKQVWLYFICRTTRPGYVGTTMNPQIVLNTPKKSSHPKKYLPNCPTQKNPGIENFKPKKICHLK